MNTKHEREYKMIGLNIAYYRKMSGLSQMQLAEASGISRTHMSNIEAPNMPTSISLGNFDGYCGCIADTGKRPAYI